MPSSLAANDQTLGYDWRGEQTSFTDQNNTVHNYLRDVLGAEQRLDVAFF